MKKFLQSKIPKKGAGPSKREINIYKEPNTHSEIIGKIKIGEPNLETKKVEYRILNKENEVVEKGISEIHGLTMDGILNIVGIK